MLDVNRDFEPEPEPLAPMREPEMDPAPEPELEPEGDPREVALTGRKQSLLDQAKTLKVLDGDSYERAGELAKTFAGMIKDAEAHFDPDIAAAHNLHRSLCDKKNTFLAPLQAALAALKEGASSWWRTEEQKRLVKQRELEQQQIDAAAAVSQNLEMNAKAEEARGDLESARYFRREASAVTAEALTTLPVVPASTPRVKGVTNREKWVATVFDPAALVAGVARPIILRELLAAFKAEQPTNVGEWLEGRLIESADVPPQAVVPDLKYLGARARTDKDTLQWPGVRFFDEGSMAVRS